MYFDPPTLSVVRPVAIIFYVFDIVTGRQGFFMLCWQLWSNKVKPKLLVCRRNVTSVIVVDRHAEKITAQKELVRHVMTSGGKGTRTGAEEVLFSCNAGCTQMKRNQGPDIRLLCRYKQSRNSPLHGIE